MFRTSNQAITSIVAGIASTIRLTIQRLLSLLFSIYKNWRLKFRLFLIGNKKRGLSHCSFLRYRQTPTVKQVKAHANRHEH